MVAFLKAIDLKVWKSAVNGYSLPTITTDRVTGPKPVHIGDIILKNVADTGVDIVATKNVE